MGIRRQLHITQGFPLTGKKAQRIAMTETTPAEAGAALEVVV